jgi:DNA adenine methylase
MTLATSTTQTAPARPFVKWAGGKTQLLHVLLPLLTSQPFRHYHEPFVGGGAVFFALAASRELERASLSDTNLDLTEAYSVITTDLEALVQKLEYHQEQNSEEYFYKLRAWRDSDLWDDTHIGRAARLLYLNKTCFNGLHRVNKAGQFNVPWGKYKHPKICDVGNLRACERALACASISCEDFESALWRVEPGDLVYLDPPYVPVSETSNFTSYSKEGFTSQDQERLAREFTRLGKLGAHLVLSNADCEEVRALYAAWNIRSVSARRNVNSKGDKRGKVGEVIVTNF